MTSVKAKVVNPWIVLDAFAHPEFPMLMRYQERTYYVTEYKMEQWIKQDEERQGNFAIMLMPSSAFIFKGLSVMFITNLLFHQLSCAKKKGKGKTRKSLLGKTS